MHLSNSVSYLRTRLSWSWSRKIDEGRQSTCRPSTNIFRPTVIRGIEALCFNSGRSLALIFIHYDYVQIDLAVDLVVVAVTHSGDKTFLPRQYNYVLYAPNDQTETLGLSCCPPTISAALSWSYFYFFAFVPPLPQWIQEITCKDQDIICSKVDQKSSFLALIFTQFEIIKGFGKKSSRDQIMADFMNSGFLIGCVV